MDTPIANDVRVEPTGSPERAHRAGAGEPVAGVIERQSVKGAGKEGRAHRPAGL
jgi:hypothetical protein